MVAVKNRYAFMQILAVSGGIPKRSLCRTHAILYSTLSSVYYRRKAAFEGELSTVDSFVGVYVPVLRKDCVYIEELSLLRNSRQLVLDVYDLNRFLHRICKRGSYILGPRR
jgi:hypothetical protein